MLFMLNVVMLIVFMLNVVVLSVFMLTVMVPSELGYLLLSVTSP
jgi:hypothetical protein